MCNRTGREIFHARERKKRDINPVAINNLGPGEKQVKNERNLDARLHAPRPKHAHRDVASNGRLSFCLESSQAIQLYELNRASSVVRGRKSSKS